ncbi:M1 family metallopeptidase [Labilibaculum sp.]|uniref:M1 family metallopeptidase n=1 Tax=Labilibaculum sp. TaxID=2060723 RepID=UPI0035625FC3
MKNIASLLVLFSILILSCTTKKNKIALEIGVSKQLANYRKENISSLEYQVYFDIPEDKTEAILAINLIRFSLQKNDQDLQIDFRENAQLIRKVICNGRNSDYRFEMEHLIIPKKELIKGDNQIKIEFVAGNSSLNRNDEFLYTLFVPDRARTVFPCFDQPDLKANFQLKLRIPISWKAMGNAEITSVKKEEEKSTYTFAKTKALPTYLFSFVAGKFDTISRERNGHKHILYHRESDPKKLAQNTDEIFRLLFQSLDWLEEYTQIPYAFGKYDLVAIPSFQYGGMEHTGATLYKASSLFLDEHATQSKLLSRANLIAHETSHMWFGDLVTMKWFDQVWLKEVFANFMADKITNPSFPELNHKLKFEMAHFPSSYSVDRTSGTNPINQQLENLKDAGSVYGSIIYHKSPIVMDMLEKITGEQKLQNGLQNYLKTYAYSNASWEDLIEILDKNSSVNLKEWSKIWVDKAGRPKITSELKIEDGKITKLSIVQKDVNGNEGHWSQKLNIILGYADKTISLPVNIDQPITLISDAKGLDTPEYLIPNGSGNGYGYFKLDEKSKTYLLHHIDRVKDDLQRGIAWINLYENLREGDLNPLAFVQALQTHLDGEKNNLILERMLKYLRTSYWQDLTKDERTQIGSSLEESLYLQLNTETDMSKKSSLFSCLSDITQSENNLKHMYKIWKQEIAIGGLSLSESKSIALACDLAIKIPEKANEIVATQIERIKNPDRKKRMLFVAPALSPNEEIRKQFFTSLKQKDQREHEPWVCEGLRYLNHPLREQEALTYLPQCLELLQEIQITGDIFFPYNWLSASYSGLSSIEAGDITRQFLQDKPNYPENLKLKILQAADLVLRKEKNERLKEKG